MARIGGLFRAVGTRCRAPDHHLNQPPLRIAQDTRCGRVLYRTHAQTDDVTVPRTLRPSRSAARRSPRCAAGTGLGRSQALRVRGLGSSPPLPIPLEIPVTDAQWMNRRLLFLASCLPYESPGGMRGARTPSHPHGPAAVIPGPAARPCWQPGFPMLLLHQVISANYPSGWLVTESQSCRGRNGPRESTMSDDSFSVVLARPTGWEWKH